MNMQALMAQAKKMQRDLEKTTNEIEQKEFKYENENITVIATGNNKIKNLEIKNQDLFEDSEILNDVIIVAINNVLDLIKKEKENKLGKYTNGLGGLF